MVLDEAAEPALDTQAFHLQKGAYAWAYAYTSPCRHKLQLSFNRQPVR